MVTVGEKVEDSLCVPKLWITNTANIKMHVNGKTRPDNDSTSTARPSTEERTDTAGVRTPSPVNNN